MDIEDKLERLIKAHEGPFGIYRVVKVAEEALYEIQCLRKLLMRQDDMPAEFSSAVKEPDWDAERKRQGKILRMEAERSNKAEYLISQLVGIDWCIGYELTTDQYAKLDNIRTEAVILFESHSNET